MERKNQMTKIGVNPKDAIGVTKPPLSTIPMTVLTEVMQRMKSDLHPVAVHELGIAMLEGSLKYGRHNYRASNVIASVYVDAAMRHIMSLLIGEDIDPDSGIHHAVKAAASLTVLRDAVITEMVFDDRPPQVIGRLLDNASREDGPTSIVEELNLASLYIAVWFDGQNYAANETTHVLTNAICVLLGLRGDIIEGKTINERKLSKSSEGINALSAKVLNLVEKYPNPEPPFTQIKRTKPDLDGENSR